MDKYPVFLGECASYCAADVEKIIQTALKQIPLSKILGGKIVIKPNLVMAHPKVATEGFTRPEVIEGILKVISTENAAIDRIDIVEKSGLGVTTAGMFRWAGYGRLKRAYGVNLCAMEERPRQRIVLQKGRVHTHISLAKEMVDRDFLIFAPKLKTNVLSQGYTGAIKLNVGSVDSKERLQFHDHRLHQKMVDILEAVNPDLIVTDGVRLSFGGNQMTQGGTDFGVIAVSSNAVAHDMVCARLLGLDPFKIDHIREAMDRGYGPTSLDQVEILGDFPLERGAQIVMDLDFGFMPVGQFQCNFRIQSGTPYCIGGCQGIFLDWLHMIKDRWPGMFKFFPRLTVLVGKVEDRVVAKKVLLLGDCAAASTDVHAGRVIRIKGCPPTHKRIVWDMMVKLGLLAPLVRPSLIWDGFGVYPLKKIKGWWVNRKITAKP